jgi:hypothetical protein
MPVAEVKAKEITQVSKDLTPKKANPVGRPSEYKPEYCDLIIDEMSNGYSFEACAPLVGVHKDTLYEWCKVHPEFSDARKKALDGNRRYWEKLGIENILNVSETIKDGKDMITTSKSINAAIWIFNMKNRFKDEWRDKQEVDHSVKNGEKPPLALSYAIPERQVEQINNDESNNDETT